MTSIYAGTLSRCTAIMIALGAATAGPIGGAAAADIRYPQTGPVAFMLHLPDKWSAKLDDSGNMLVISPDHSSAMSLTVVTEDATTLKQTPDQFANASLAVAKAEPFNKHEPGSIAGFAADTYYSRMINPSNVKIVVKMNLIKPMHGRIVSESILTIANINSAQLAALATALNGITLTGAK